MNSQTKQKWADQRLDGTCPMCDLNLAGEELCI
jgi:hypothetical protein